MKMYAGQPLDRGEVFHLRNQPNDGKLLKWDYVVEVEEGTETVTCTVCSREFADENYKNAHARMAHRDNDPIVVDGPNLKRPKRAPGVGPDPDGNGNWDLEPEGAPAPEPVGAGAPLAPDKGSRQESTGKGVREVFRL